MYFFIIEHCNRLGWKEKFGLPTTMVKDAIGIKNFRTYTNALNDLVEWGFIIMIEKSKNQYSSNIIAIVKNTIAPTIATTKALDKALQKHSTKHCKSIDSIDKQLNNITINNSSSTPSTSEIFSDHKLKVKYETFMLTDSTQKEILAMNHKITKKEVEELCVSFVLKEIKDGSNMDSHKPDFNKHFGRWAEKYGIPNLMTLKKENKEQINAQFKKLNIYQDGNI